MFLNLRDLMMRADLYSIKTLKEVDEDPGYSDCMKLCGSSKNLVDHISSFKCFEAKRYLQSEDISHQI